MLTLILNYKKTFLIPPVEKSKGLRYTTMSNKFVDFDNEIANTPVSNNEVKVSIPKTIACFVRQNNDRTNLNLEIKEKLSEVLSDSKFQYEDARYQFKFFLIRDNIFVPKYVMSEANKAVLNSIYPNLDKIKDLAQNLSQESPDAKWVKRYQNTLNTLHEITNNRINFNNSEETDLNKNHPVDVYINKFIEHLHKKGVFKAQINIKDNIFKRMALKGNIQEPTFIEEGVYINITRDEILSTIKNRKDRKKSTKKVSKQKNENK